ncbi:hypothetical protein V5799_010664 [Amblyomma americanum]|uniref:Uncharacterized protein n=1 Tax=Amblyomma americanum TaxID=6943 RepID=A0AAQ4EJD1_AMBAM
MKHKSKLARLYLLLPDDAAICAQCASRIRRPTEDQNTARGLRSRTVVVEELLLLSGKNTASKRLDRREPTDELTALLSSPRALAASALYFGHGSYGLVRARPHAEDDSSVGRRSQATPVTATDFWGISLPMSRGASLSVATVSFACAPGQTPRSPRYL